jgi:hypothetical protein
MPRIITGVGQRNVLSAASTREYKYEYPNKLDLKPNSKIHNKLVDCIINLINSSIDNLDVNRKRYKNQDNVLTSYIYQDDEEKRIKSKDSRKPTSIVFPYSYAILDSLLTYMSMAFLRDPICRYEHVSGKDYLGAVLLEAVISQQTRRSRTALALHTIMKNAFSYGVGYGVVGWETITGKRSTVTEPRARLANLAADTPDRQRSSVTIYEGNKLYPLNPYLTFSDPNVSATDVQSGEFFGWLENTNFLALKNEELNNDSMFNVEYAKHLTNTVSQFMVDEAVQANDGRNDVINTTSSLTRPIDVLKVIVKFIPSEWEVFNSDEVETWLFRIAGDSLLIGAEKLDLDHGKIPVVATAPEYDGRSASPVSKLETLYGLQSVGDWLYNSHITNVRKSLNNMLIVDPSMVNMNDLRDPAPGKMIRTRKPAWGRGVDGAIKQLKIDDITRQNIGDAGFIQSAMELAAGTDGSMMGSLRNSGPERLTKGEFQGTRTSAISRLERIALIISLQLMHDLSDMFATNTQQFMSNNTYIKITEGLEQDLIKQGFEVENKRLKVKFQDLLIPYDVKLKDGSIPGGNFSDGWMDLYKLVVENEALSSRLDIFKLFKFIAYNFGAKNVDKFELKPQVMPDQQVENMAQRGDIVPFNPTIPGAENAI